MNQSIIACGKKVFIGTPVILWHQKGGYACPNRRGRSSCTQHNSKLNDQPTKSDKAYKITDPTTAYEELKSTVHQFILHYDVCYCTYHCHEILEKSSFKGSHFYLDLDGTIYQTCDLYWKTNTAPADDGKGNQRSIHVEISNLSWEALASESELHRIRCDIYRKANGRWHFKLPDRYKKKIHTKSFKPAAARAYGKRGWFSRRINGKIVRMWDFTEEQYQALIHLCLGVNKLLPRIKLQVPYDKESRRTPLNRLKAFSTFSGILGHAHVQGGVSENISTKFDPGSAFNWGRLRRAFQREKAKP
ncbi:MAG: N-acetylmuramoyl-L-alanine amidase [Nitrospinota bacterium]|nr:N-acetylmuramoyl-L-alanine amidase [Nitrospinota bacterium]